MSKYKTRKKDTVRKIQNLVTKAEGLLKQVGADISKSKNTPIDIYRNRCLGYINTLNKLDRKRLDIPIELYEEARKRMFETYFNLQNSSATARSTEENKEIPLDTIMDILDSYTVESHSSEMYSGGLGFSTANGLLLGDRFSAPSMYDHYFKKVPVQEAVSVPKEEWGAYESNESNETMEEWRERMKIEKKKVLE